MRTIDQSTRPTAPSFAFMMRNLVEAVSSIEVATAQESRTLPPPSDRDMLKVKIVSWMKQIKQSSRQDLADHFTVDQKYLSTLLTELKREGKLRNIGGSNPMWLIV